MLVLSGIVVIVVGFALGLNPMLVVTAAAFSSAAAAGHGPVEVVTLIGHAFVDNRFLMLPMLIVPMIGLLERAGLREEARRVIGRLRGVTAGRLLLAYLILRQLTAAIGLTALGGKVQMVRPIVAPMAEAAAPDVDASERALLRAHAAAADNIGAFFGEDVFVAVGSVLLIRAVLHQNGIEIDPLRIAVWAIPTAVAALLAYGAHLLLLDRRLRRHGRRP